MSASQAYTRSTSTRAGSSEITYSPWRVANVTGSPSGARRRSTPRHDSSPASLCRFIERNLGHRGRLQRSRGETGQHDLGVSGQAPIRAAEGVFVVRPEHRRDRRDWLGANTDGDGSSPGRSDFTAASTVAALPTNSIAMSTPPSVMSLTARPSEPLGSMRITSSAPRTWPAPMPAGRHLHRSPPRHRRSGPFVRRILRVLRLR